jgi:predicted kinase
MKQKPKLLALKGLPASGKSTYAKTLVEQGWVRSNKDTIRLDERLFPEGYNFKNKGHEKKVIRERNRIVTEALQNGQNVVVDDTNLNPVHLKDLAAIARQNDADFEIDDSFLKVPLQECIDRDRLREESVGASVIRRMFHDYIKKPLTALEYDPTLPMAIIVDIDGTLAHMDGGRSPYDEARVGQDRVDDAVAHLVDAVNCIGYAKVFIFSGRNDSCRSQTEEWLERNDIEYSNLYMRRTDHLDEKGNPVKDTLVKAEMLEKYIVGQYNVLFVVDDRPSVCRMWRDVYGLRVLQVGDPYYEF